MRSGAASSRSAKTHPSTLLALVVLLLTALSASAQTASKYIPPVVVTSAGTVPVTVLTAPFKGSQTNVTKPQDVSLDACGNIYTLDFGNNGSSGTTVTQIPAGGGIATVVSNVGAYYPGHMGQDAAYKNLIVDQAYGTGPNLIPLVNCIPQSSSSKHVGGGNGALFYYYNPGYVVGDFTGNVLIATNGTCCVTGNYYLVQEVGNAGTILLTNQAAQVGSMAADQSGNIYYISAGLVYKLAYSGGKYSATPTSFGTPYSNPIGISVDQAGNLYIADQGTSTLYEIPNEPTGSGTTSALNLADQFIVATGVNINTAPAINARGDIFYTQTNATGVTQLSLGNANYGKVAVGQGASRTIRFQFNASLSPASIKMPSGSFAAGSNNQGVVTCTAGATYGPGSSNVCSLTVTFTPTQVGSQSDSIVLADAKGNAIATAVVEGVGQGALITVDPGTVSSIGSGLKSAANVAVDATGNTYVADPGNNTVTKFPAGGGAAVSLSVTVANLPLSAPAGVAIDGGGNVFIADTGNNRVVEIPSISGALSLSSAFVVASGLKAPASVFIHINGDLYIADTGNNAVRMYPRVGGGFGPVATIGTALLAPLAVTVDSTGNLYIADSGNNQIVEIPNGGTQQTVDAGLLNPSALTTDASGSLFIVDKGNNRVVRVPSVNGALNTNDADDVTLNVAYPYGVVIDSASNLYVTDSTTTSVYMLARSQVTLGFGSLVTDTSSSPLPIGIENAGNQPLIFSKPYFVGTGNLADFTMSTGTGICADSLTLVPGDVCDITTVFTPKATGARSATLSFSSTNATVPAAVTLTGTGITLVTTTTTVALTTPSTGAPFYGQPLVFTAKVAATGGGTPTGNVLFVVDGGQTFLRPLTAGSATIGLNSGLTGGAHSVYAVYKGDPLDNGSSSTSLVLNIARAPTTASLIVTKIPYNNPYSLRHQNTGSCSVTDTLGYTNLFPAIPNDAVQFMGSVTSPGVGIPSGTLTFFSDGKLINANSTTTPAAPSIATLLPAAGGTFSALMSSDANTLGDGTTLGENNILLGPHNITVVYSGDKNYLPNTSAAILVTVVDVSPTTPIILPKNPVQPKPYCDPTSSISGSRPADPSAFTVAASSNSLTATAATPGTVDLTISSLGGFNGTISFSCPDLPQYATCTTNPGVATIIPSTPGAPALPTVVRLTVTTNVPPYVPTANQGGYWLTSLILGLVVYINRRRSLRLKSVLTGCGLAMMLFGSMLGFSGCSTSGNSTVVTKAGSYPVTVTMTAGRKDPQGYNEVFVPDVPLSMPFTLTVQ